MKRTLALLLSLLLVATLLPAVSLAEEAPTTLTIMRFEHTSFTYSMDQPVIKALEDRLGIHIDLQVYPTSDYKTKLRMLLATNDLPDITLSTYTDFANYVSEDMFVNLSDHWDELPNYAKTIDRFSDLTGAFKVGGDLHWFIMTAEDAEAYGNTPLVRQDALAAAGWDRPPDNFEELYQVLKDIKAWDPGSIPFVTRGTDVLWRMGYAYGTYDDIYYEPDHGRYEYGPLYDRYASFLGYLNKLYAEGLLDADFATSNQATWMENLTSGKSYFFFDNGSFTTDVNMITVARDPEARFVPMLTLENSFGTRRNEFFEGVGYICPFRNDVWVINSESEHVEEALRFMDYLYSEEGAMLTSYGIEGEDYTLDEEGEVQPIMEKVDYYKANANDPYREYKNSLGTGALAVSGRFYETRKWFLDDDSNAMFDFWLKDPHMLPKSYTLSLSPAQSDAVIDKKTACDTYVASESLKFIMGTRPLEEFGSFAEELIRLGAQDVEAVYNEAHQASLQ
jgi:putative aldouronate transport system substrate-binding protein